MLEIPFTAAGAVWVLSGRILINRITVHKISFSNEGGHGDLGHMAPPLLYPSFLRIAQPAADNGQGRGASHN